MQPHTRTGAVCLALRPLAKTFAVFAVRGAGKRKVREGLTQRAAKKILDNCVWALFFVALFILHRADDVAFGIFEEDQGADGWDVKLRHHDLAAVCFHRGDCVVD